MKISFINIPQGRYVRITTDKIDTNTWTDPAEPAAAGLKRKARHHRAQAEAHLKRATLLEEAAILLEAEVV